MDNFLFFVFFLFFIAAFTQDDFIFTILYLFTGAYILGRWWSGRAIHGLSFIRELPSRAFWGEEILVQLRIINNSLLPLVWLRIHESLPIELGTPNYLRQVISLGPRKRAEFSYVVKARKRGYYPIGPLFVSSGDLFGLTNDKRREGNPDHLTVYPRIFQFSSFKLPSRSPMGTLRHSQPVYEDPTRVYGKRDYQAGDSMRRIDWKASALANKLQVKLYEPSIALETAIFLNLNNTEYHIQTRLDATELAIVIAASISNWIVSQGQTVGLITNGLDPLVGDQSFNPIPPRKGRNHLMRILETLARVESAETMPIIDLLRKESVHLPWRTTVVLITGKIDDLLYDELFQIHRRGMEIVIILVGLAGNLREVRAKAEHFGFTIYHIRGEVDLDSWRN